MKKFLRENWPYIVAPLAVILVLLVALIVFGGDGPASMIYNIF